MEMKVAATALILALMNVKVLEGQGVEGEGQGSCCSCSSGVPGIPGVPGPYGPAGPKGDLGFPGDVGMQGAKGDKGSDGLNGERGTTGEPGQKGDQGVGQPGKQGPQGLRGIAGVIGEKGVTGTSGLKGQKGESGERKLRAAFTVVRNSPFTRSFSDSTHLAFEETIFAEAGTLFDLSTGTFTCTIPGTYVFTFSVGKDDGETLFAALKKNNFVIVSSFVSDGNTHHVSNSAVISLRRGDLVYVVVNGQVYSESYHPTSFTGFLLNSY